MKISPSEHAAHPFLVHDLAADFELLDVWRLPVKGGANDFASFTELMNVAEPPSRGAAGALFRLRDWLGRVFGWDDAERLPIPGCEETSIVARLDQALSAEAPRFDPTRAFQLVYTLPREQLLEISNGTVHALMHLSWVEQTHGLHTAHMAVYCKTRGWLGRAYMTLIAPFRTWIVYPAMLRHIGRRWRSRVTLRPSPT